MKQKLLLLLVAVATCVFGLRAATLPETSTADKEVWYYIQFTRNGSLVTAKGDGQQCQWATFANSKAQTWKITGDPRTGYQFYNKLGQQLYLTSTAVDQGFLYAAETPATSNTNFVLTATPDGNNWLISPKTNTGAYMNQYGGLSNAEKKIGLYHEKGDAGSAMNFMQVEDNPLKLIPYPTSLTQQDGTVDLKTLTAISYPDAENQTLVTDFATQLQLTSGISLNVVTTDAAPAKGAITLTVNSSLADEQYTLNSDADGVRIEAAGHAGFFYAIQTLKQLLPTAYFGKNLQAGADWTIPCLTIEDKPALGHRGFMLDIARHFFDKTEVKRVLDIMAFYKLNRLHWHLTDDQGWRIEVPKWPKLTEVGAVRSGSFVNAADGNFYDDTEYGRGCFYTVEDLKEIVAYAAERNIDIMPEIDLPGHMVAAVASYPELGCHPDTPSEVRIDGGISRDVLNIGKDEVVDFLKDVLDVVCDVFPFPYVHIGGDECPTDQWTNNADCLKRVRDEGLTGVNQLQSWLVEELGIWLKEKHGKDIVVWDELLSHWNDANTVKPIIMAWNSINKSSEAANHGFKSIIVPYQTLYLDFYQVDQADRRTDELYQGGWGDGFVNSLPEIYEFNPLSALSGREEFALGVQGNMWTETCNNNVQLEYQMLPRFMALAEDGWNLQSQKRSLTDFLLRMQPHGAILDSLNYTYAKHYFFEPELTPAESAIAEASDILEKSKPGLVGYADEAAHEALKSALEALKADAANEGKLTALTNEIATFKTAPIVQPTPGKAYQIVSAATYYRQLYNGSTMYEKDGQVRFHYTPQIEPEELWQFEANGTGYTLKSYMSGKTLAIPAYNQNVTMGDDATALRVDKATVPVKDYDYIPGTVTISAVNGYAAAETGDINRLFGGRSGYVTSYNEPQLCHAGTWYIVEVTDFRAQLQGLVNKALHLINYTETGGYNQPTEEALAFLLNNVVLPANKVLDDETALVSEETYKSYMALYEEYLAMPRKQVYDVLDEESVYTISLCYAAWSTTYAKADVTSKKVVPAQYVSGNKAFEWYIKKLGNGQVKLFSNANGQATYVNGFSDGNTILLGTEAQGYSWQLIYNDTPEASGICISNGTLSWYSNPNSFNTILLKPNNYGAAMWKFTKVPGGTITGIHDATIDDSTPASYYDLSGRKVAKPAAGLYITNQGKKVVIK